LNSKLHKLSNEFKFPIASIHHAGETDLVPDLLLGYVASLLASHVD